MKKNGSSVKDLTCIFYVKDYLRILKNWRIKTEKKLITKNKYNLLINN